MRVARLRRSDAMMIDADGCPRSGQRTCRRKSLALTRHRQRCSDMGLDWFLIAKPTGGFSDCFRCARHTVAAEMIRCRRVVRRS
jgi:hypothetical protein